MPKYTVTIPKTTLDVEAPNKTTAVFTFWRRVHGLVLTLCKVSP